MVDSVIASVKVDAYLEAPRYTRVRIGEVATAQRGGGLFDVLPSFREAQLSGANPPANPEYVIWVKICNARIARSVTEPLKHVRVSDCME